MKLYTGTTDDYVMVTYKIDGVRGIKKDGVWRSRADKPLYNLPLDIGDGEYEIYLGDFKSSIQACRTKESEMIPKLALFRLLPVIDPRLIVGIHVLPSTIPELMERALDLRYEGLVIYTSEGPFKLKNTITLDVRIIDMIEGRGRNAGTLGALVVEYEGETFKVGTGLTDLDRQQFWSNKTTYIGQIIEISGMELTERGVLRHPRFERRREDLK